MIIVIDDMGKIVHIIELNAYIIDRFQLLWLKMNFLFSIEQRFQWDEDILWWRY